MQGVWTLGWSAGGSPNDSHLAGLQVVKLPLKIVQTAAVLEIMHAATGLVRAPVFTTCAPIAPTASIYPMPVHSIALLTCLSGCSQSWDVVVSQ